MKYLTIDGMFSGTGIRDSVEGDYINIEEYNIPCKVKARFNKWLKDYEKAHFFQYSEEKQIIELDKEGKKLSEILQTEIPDSKIEYYSSAKMMKIV